MYGTARAFRTNASHLEENLRITRDHAQEKGVSHDKESHMRSRTVGKWTLAGAAGVIVVGALSVGVAHAAEEKGPSTGDEGAGSTPAGDQSAELVAEQPDPSSSDTPPDDGTATPDAFALSLPGDGTDDVVDPATVPGGLFHGSGAAVVSTRVDDTVLSGFSEDTGMQVLTRVPSADSAMEYRFSVTIPDGFHAVVRDDGSVAVEDADSQVGTRFLAPEAVDANGAAVDAVLRVDGSDIIESVAPAPDAAFPVVSSLEQSMDGDAE
ncbi:hypothetical protein [Clavibacter michiganensis]|uniref:hypothetical protein n=2 Tax=Clavibacter TaxID=1573 RepID=UPI001BE069DE|nr:hypothetical protein [Clavibacter michiganensis]MBT1634765.1 hypothetical protein [Clavibacter michiganensis]